EIFTMNSDGSNVTRLTDAGPTLVYASFQPDWQPLPIPLAISDVKASTDVLWPPNHNLVNITIDYEAHGTPPVECALSVASNETDAEGGLDWIVLDSHHVDLRADRLGGGSGRVYTVTVTCRDRGGATVTSTTSVRVPHDQRPA